jgi:16S rRNA (guanine527-N7)-methyltransferase
MLPPESATRLREGAEALGVPLAGTQWDALLGYLELLQRWNAVYNLTAVRDPEQMVVQHLLDSLAVVAPLQREVTSKPFRLLDVGSGAGLPGVVIAVACAGADVTCVDAVGKKATFVRQAAAELRIANLCAVHSRVEDLRAGAFQVITARAFASLADLVRATRHLLLPGGAWMAMKGKAFEFRPELEVVRKSADVFHVERLTVPGLGAERHLVWIREPAGSAVPGG